MNRYLGMSKISIIGKDFLPVLSIRAVSMTALDKVQVNLYNAEPTSVEYTKMQRFLKNI